MTAEARSPHGATFVGRDQPQPFTPTLAANQLTFLAPDTNVAAFVDAGAYAAFWPGGTVMPNSYGSSSWSHLVP